MPFTKEVKLRSYKIGIDAKDEEGNFAGTASAHINKGKLCIDNIYTARRGEGLGSELLNEVIDWAKQQGLTEIEGGNFKPSVDDPGGQSAREWYRKRGIKVDEKGKLKGQIK